MSSYERRHIRVAAEHARKAIPDPTGEYIHKVFALTDRCSKLQPQGVSGRPARRAPDLVQVLCSLLVLIARLLERDRGQEGAGWLLIRADAHQADVEIRALAVECLRQLQWVAPNVFDDYAITTLADGTEVADHEAAW